MHDGVYVDVYNLADKLFLDKNLFFHDKFHLYSSSFLCIDFISFLSFVSNDLFLSLWIYFLTDMYMHMFPHIICFMYSNLTNCTPPRLAMLFAVYMLYLCLYLYMNK